jgi:hypothetical protein
LLVPVAFVPMFNRPSGVTFPLTGALSTPRKARESWVLPIRLAGGLIAHDFERRRQCAPHKR